MRTKGEKGNFVEWLLIFVAISVVIFAIVVPKTVLQGLFSYSPFPDGPATSTTQGPTTLSKSQSKPSSVKTQSTAVSSSLSISIGNAAYSYQPSDEYIIISNSGSNSVDMTGYTLENAKGSRAYAVGSSEVRFSSDAALIPQGANPLAGSGGSSMRDIVLKPGERAIVTTGNPANLNTSYILTSFKENKCTGYFAETYSFPSGINRLCVRPGSELGVGNFDRQCQDYIDSMQTCHAPKFNTVDTAGHTFDDKGRSCSGCVDGTASLTPACVDFIRTHYSYAGCVAYHSSDKDFESSTWHVYLGKTWELWATSRETISLYDRSGRVVATNSY